MKLIAVTGGIATGKSLVSGLLAKAFGCPACSCDEIVHRLLVSPSVIQMIGERFPSAIASLGGIDRIALANIVFSSAQRRKELEALLHPLVLRDVAEWVSAHDSSASMGVVEVPLLYEVDFPINRDVDVVVACSERTQIRRLAQREGGSGRAVDRIGAQMPIAEKISRAEVVIWNEGSLGTLTRLVALAARGIHQKTQ